MSSSFWNNKPVCSGCSVTEILMFEEAAEQQAADLLHRVLRGEGDGSDQVVLFAATLDLAEEVLQQQTQQGNTLRLCFC